MTWEAQYLERLGMSAEEADIRPGTRITVLKMWECPQCQQRLARLHSHEGDRYMEFRSRRKGDPKIKASKMVWEDTNMSLPKALVDLPDEVVIKCKTHGVVARVPRETLERMGTPPPAS